MGPHCVSLLRIVFEAWRLRRHLPLVLTTTEKTLGPRPVAPCLVLVPGSCRATRPRWRRHQGAVEPCSYHIPVPLGWGGSQTRFELALVHGPRVACKRTPPGGAERLLCNLKPLPASCRAFRRQPACIACHLAPTLAGALAGPERPDAGRRGGRRGLAGAGEPRPHASTGGSSKWDGATHARPRVAVASAEFEEVAPLAYTPCH